MIDHQRRAIFIHIPKTAGVSIYDAFGIRDQQGHLTIDDYSDHRHEYFSFSFVRNPWDRALSIFLYLKKGGRGNPPDLQAQATLYDCETFDHFAKNIGEYRQRLTTVHAPPWGVMLETGESVRRYPHLLPQTRWTHDIHERQQLDYVGRFESLDKDFAVVGRHLGETFVLPHHNATDHGDYRAYYNHRSRGSIARAYESDIELLRYRF